MKVTMPAAGIPNPGYHAAFPASDTTAPGTSSRTSTAETNSCARAPVVGVIGVRFAGQGHHCRVMEIVIPKRVKSITAVCDRLDQACFLRFVFPDQNDGSFPGGAAGCHADVGNDVVGRIVMDVLCGIQTQTIQMILTDPVGGILPEEFADGLAIFAVEVDSLTPIRLCFSLK